MTKKNTLIYIFILCALTTSVMARPLPVEQDPNIHGGCGGELSPILTKSGYTAPIANPPASLPSITEGVSTKRTWKEYYNKDCIVKSYYMTYQVGVCEDHEPKCNIRIYKNRIRTYDVCITKWDMF